MKKIFKKIIIVFISVLMVFQLAPINVEAKQPTKQANTGTYTGSVAAYQTIGFSLMFNGITTSVSTDDSAVKLQNETTSSKWNKEFEVVELANKERRARGSIRIRRVDGTYAYFNYDIVVTPPNFNSNNLVVGRSLVDNLYSENKINKADLDKALAIGGEAWINPIISVRTQNGTHTSLKSKKLWRQGSSNYGTPSRVFTTSVVATRFTWSDTTTQVLKDIFDNKFTFPQIDDDPPTLVSSSVSASGTTYRESDSVLWVRPNSKVTAKVKQRDTGSGNKYQYLAINKDSTSLARSRHDFSGGSTGNIKQLESKNIIEITSASRVVSNSNRDGEITWSITPKGANDSYALRYHFNDNADNKSGYSTFHTVKTDSNAPTFESVSVEDASYVSGNDYWFKPNDQATLKIQQKDTGSGNNRQYLRVNNGSDIRASHGFNSDASSISSVSNFSMSNDYVSIDSAKRAGTGQTQTVTWGVTLKKASEVYTPQYHFNDRVGNNNGYDTGSGGLGVRLLTDGTAPTHISSTVDGERYKDGDDYWVRPGDALTVTYRQRDTESGNKRGYIRLNGNDQDVRFFHDFNNKSSKHLEKVNDSFGNTTSVEVQNVNRTEHNTSTGYSETEWDVRLNTSGHTYDLQYYHRDNVNNNVDYTTVGKARVDGVAPTMSFSQNISEYTNGNVIIKGVASDALSGVKRIQKPDGAWTNDSMINYTVSSNGTYSFVAEDNVGNRETYSITISNIDKTAPIVSISPNGGDYARSHSTQIKASDVGSGINNLQYSWTTSRSFPTSGFVNTTNGSEASAPASTGTHYLHIKATDRAGNTTKFTSQLFRVDRTAPEATFSLSTEDWTNQPVVILMRQAFDGHSGYYRTRQPDGSYVTDNQLDYTISKNGEYQFVVYDQVGNSKSYLITVSNIDKEVPVLEIEEVSRTDHKIDIRLNYGD